jgi:hypothetical protein
MLNLLKIKKTKKLPLPQSEPSRFGARAAKVNLCGESTAQADSAQR